MNEADLLAATPHDRAVTGAYLAAALRRGRRAILVITGLCALAALLATFVLPRTHSASTTLLLRYPDGADATHAIATDLSLLTTRPVAAAALTSLHSTDDPALFLADYHGKILSDGVMQITARASSDASAVQRANAVASAFLAFRQELLRDQLDAQIAELRRQAPTNPQANAQIAAATLAVNTVGETSRVIDSAIAKPSGVKTQLAINAASSGLVGLALSAGFILTLAVVSPRVRRRADVAAALRAPVAVSVGPVVPTGWRRLLPGQHPTPDRPNRDLERIVRHLQRTLTLTSARALVVVSIDSTRVARLVLQACERRLTAAGRRVAIVTSDGENLHDRAMTNETDANWRAVDVVLVLAELDPARGAEHLREWGADAVAFVTAGRSAKTTLESHSAMIRSASLELHSAVLLDADPSDETLGIYEHHSTPATGLDAVDNDAVDTAMDANTGR